LATSLYPRPGGGGKPTVVVNSEDLKPQTDKAPKTKIVYKILFAKACIKYTKGVNKTAIISFTL
jgi:hypothetical protein